jgi:hypothetical protein
MSVNIGTALVQSYKANIEVQFQQKGSRLRSTVRNEVQNAEYDFYDRIGPTDAVEITSRHGDTPLISTTHDRRRCHMKDYDWADMIDKPDRIRMLADPTAPYTMNAVYALGRKMDDLIISEATGTAYTGKTGSTSTTHPAASQIAVDYVETGSTTNSNLTIAKLRRARYLLDSEEAVEDGEALYCVVSASQIQALLRTTEVTSADYSSVKALVMGEIDTFMGFKFVRTQRLSVASNVRTCLVYPQSGMTLAVGEDIMVDVGPRRDKRNSVQVYVRASFGAVRMWEEKVISIACDETK